MVQSQYDFSWDRNVIYWNQFFKVVVLYGEKENIYLKFF